MAMADADLSYCGQQVRKHDNDRFLTALFAPPERREALFALYAFNLEIARTREVVSEPTIGLIRLQWWRDAIDAAYDGGDVPAHEVTRPLAAAIARHGLSRRHFETLLEAREADLDDEPTSGMACLVSYATATAAPLVHLAMEILDVRDGAPLEAGCGVAVGYALAGVLRAVPFHARQGRVLLPADRLAAHGGGPQEVLDLKPGPATRAVVGEVAAAAREALVQARAFRPKATRAALPALLPATLAGVHLDVIARAGNDVLAPRVLMPNPFRHVRLAWAALRGRY